MIKADVRAAIAALRPAAEAFARAQRVGYVTLDEDCGWLVMDSILPAESDNPDQLSLV